MINIKCAKKDNVFKLSTYSLPLKNTHFFAIT